MVIRLGSPDTPEDSRLRVLWVEDLSARWLGTVNVPDLSRWFRIVVVESPEDVSELLSADANDVKGARELPFDCYLTDFRLCDIRDSCQNPEHEVNGVHAPGAGFILGLLTALRFPRSPQSVIPYSIYPTEFGPVWSLLSRFCPDQVSVLVDEAVTKNKSLHDILKLCAIQQRAAIAKSINGGLMSLPLGARDRFEEDVARAVKAGEGLAADAHVLIIGEHGGRAIRVGALFFDSLWWDEAGNAKVSAKAVETWLHELVAVGAETREARELTDFFYVLYGTDESEDIYRVARWKRDGVEFAGHDKIPNAPPPFPRLAGFARGEHVVGRLCVLFFLIRRHHQYATARFKPESSELDVLELLARLQAQHGEEASDEFVDQIRAASVDRGGEGEVRSSRSPVRSIGENRGREAERMSGTLSKILETAHVICSGLVDPLRAYERAAPPGPLDVIRFLEPFPDSWETPLTLSKDTTIGAWLADRGLLELSRGEIESVTLSPTERTATVAFARELSPDDRHWPLWLQNAL